eukprot:Blabericola_migrator_1__11831@NODE_719_length_6741_cov_45_534312_g518_i0_p1_GENE_NODE_719_length_6741_cov_45_534312_g518_i0NODE_719_length_6741_cov_45_534312_g518_i0_p1_ORF_typecomplete_len653_score62_82UME/PF08064_13/1_7UME/PF08064_13/6_7UME/PF08064_13/9_2e03_NODE_719_length_6741_cov_45_534312_g518_i026714629
MRPPRAPQPSTQLQDDLDFDDEVQEDFGSRKSRLENRLEPSIIVGNHVKRRRTELPLFAAALQPTAPTMELVRTAASESDMLCQRKVSDASDAALYSQYTVSRPIEVIPIPPHLLKAIEDTWTNHVKCRERAVSCWYTFFQQLQTALSIQTIPENMNYDAFKAWHAVAWTLITGLAEASLEHQLSSDVVVAVNKVLTLIVKHAPAAAVFWLPRPPVSVYTQREQNHPEEGPINWWVFTQYQCAGGVRDQENTQTCLLCSAREYWHNRSTTETDDACLLSLIQLFKVMLLSLLSLETQRSAKKRIEEHCKTKEFPRKMSLCFTSSSCLTKSPEWTSTVMVSTASVQEPTVSFIRALLVPLLFSARCVCRLPPHVERIDGCGRALLSLMKAAVIALVHSVSEARAKNGLFLALPSLLELKLQSWSVSEKVRSTHSWVPAPCCYAFATWLQVYDAERSTVLFLEYVLFIIHGCLTIMPQLVDRIDEGFEHNYDLIEDFSTMSDILWELTNLESSSSHCGQPWWNYKRHGLPFNVNITGLKKIGCSHSLQACVHTIPLSVPTTFVIHLIAHSKVLLEAFGVYSSVAESPPIIRLWLDANFRYVIYVHVPVLRGLRRCACGCVKTPHSQFGIIFGRAERCQNTRSVLGCTNFTTPTT